MIELSIDNASVQSIVNDIKRLDSAGKKSVRQAANWAGVTICTSLAARTKVAKKSRKATTGDFNGVTVKGVNIFRGSKEVFTPLFNSKTFTAVPVTAQNGKKLFLIKPQGVWLTVEEFKKMIRGVAENKELLKVSMAGLAKKSWRWLQSNVKRGGQVNEEYAGKVVKAGSVTWTGDNLTIHNRLGYIQSALIGGNSAVSDAIEKAAKSFKWKVDELLGVSHGVKTQ